jgi:hypothetical protein
MNDNLEFHYVVVYREGIGWHFDYETTTAAFPDGTIFDRNQVQFIISDEPEVTDTDLANYAKLQKALEFLNLNTGD